jgi:hypothetical protein
MLPLKGEAGGDHLEPILSGTAPPECIPGGGRLRRCKLAADPDWRSRLTDLRGTIAIVLKDPDLTIATLQPVWDAEYQSEPVLFLIRPASVFRHPAWKEQVRKYGVLDLWKSRGFPDWCKPVGADNFECDSGD